MPKSKKRSAPSSDLPESDKRRRVTESHVATGLGNVSSVVSSPDGKRKKHKKVKGETLLDQNGLLETEDLQEEEHAHRSARARSKRLSSELLDKEEDPTPLGVKPRRIKGEAVLIKEEHQFDVDSPKKKTNVKKATTVVSMKGEDSVQAEASPKKKKPRKTKEEKELETMPLAVRTAGLRMYVGAHVSCAKGVHNSVTNAVHIGGNSFACFLKSQRKWENPPLHDEHKDQFHSLCTEHEYEGSKHILPHGSYLVNLAQNDPDKAKQAYDAFIDDLKRCEALGIKLYNFHPGSTLSQPRHEAIGCIAAALNRAHKETSKVKPVLENMAGQGNIIGATFEDLRDIIEKVEDKSRIGVCIDTCHTFAAGYDLRTPEAFINTLNLFDKIVGMEYLSALHINDSKGPFNSHRDLHQNIGLGFLGLRAFHNVMNEPRFEGLPLVLETPIDSKDDQGKVVEDKRVWASEIKLLESLIGMDPESNEFKTLEGDLSAKGAVERRKLQEVFERKQEKDRKAAENGKTKGKKRSKAQETEVDSSAGGLSDISD